MHRMSLSMLCLLLLLAGAAAAKEKDPAPQVTSAAEKSAGEKSAKERPAKEKASDAKQLSGMSIVGNDEAPKSLFIVPWKRSEIGEEAKLHKMLNESAVPVDRDEFQRQLELYEVSTKK